MPDMDVMEQFRNFHTSVSALLGSHRTWITEFVTVMMTQSGIRPFSSSPSGFVSYTETEFAGGYGLNVSADSPPRLRLANAFQNTWAGRLLTYDAARDVYTFTCDAAQLVRGEHPVLDLLLAFTDGSDALLPGGTRLGQLTFRMERGVLTAVTDTMTQRNAFGEGRYPLTHCMALASQLFHVAQHMSNGVMIYASQDFADDRDAIWRLLNLGGESTHEGYAKVSMFITQAPLLYSRAFNQRDLASIKKSAINDLFAKPCDSARYLPVNVNESHKQYFAAPLQRIQRLVCDESNRMEIPSQKMAQYMARLRTVLGETEVSGIEAWEPIASAIMIGVEHSMSFSLGLLHGTDIADSKCTPQKAFGLILDSGTSCRWKYWEWQANVAVWMFTSDTVNLERHVQSQCKDPNTTSGSMSIDNELLHISRLPTTSANNMVSLRRISIEISAISTEVSRKIVEREAEGKNMQSNYSFVLGSQFCITSATWV